MLSDPKRRRRGRRKEQGMAVMMTAFSMIMLIPVAGLAVDGGLAYMVKTRLSGAADSAALAAVRALNGNMTTQQAQTQATNLALTYFNGNFPAGYLNTDSTTTNRQIATTFTLGTGAGNGGNGVPNGLLQVKVALTVNAPTFFMKWLGYNNLPIAVSGTATRRQLVMVLVLDESSSMGSRSSSVGTTPTTLDTTTASSCEAMVYSASQFLNYFSSYDYIGVVPFNLTASTVYPPATGLSGVNGAKQTIANINCGSNTNTTAALEVAYRQIKTTNLPLANNVIVLFTDGVPNAVNAAFPIRTQTDTRLSASKCSGVECSYPACGLLANDTVTGAIAQWANFDPTVDKDFGGPVKSIDTDASPSLPVSAAACPSSGTDFVQQTIAYIPTSDAYGNNTSGPYDTWLYQVNSHTAPAGTQITPGNSPTKNLGEAWSPNHTTYGLGAPSNQFKSGPYKNNFRPDTANSIGVVSMNTAVNEAAKIRADSTYRITIHSIYLQGNKVDPVDRAFLQIVTNQPSIAPVIYDNTAAAYANTYYNNAQQVGLWLPTTSTAGLTALFGQVASSLLRISQ